MAGIDSAKDTSIIAGTGAVYIGAPDTAVGDFFKTYDIKKPFTAPSGWGWLGHTSKDNMIEFNKDGGEVTVRDTWEIAALRTEVSKTVFGATINSVHISQQTLELAFPGGKWTAENNSYGVSGSGVIQKAVFIVIKDSVNGYAGIYFPNAAVSLGEMPKLAADNFLEIQLKVTGNASPTTGESIRFFVPPVVTGTV